VEPKQVRPKFLYDSDCGPCSKLKDAASFFDASKKIDFVPIADAARQGMLTSLPKRDWFASAHMLRPDGKTTSASDSMVDLLSLLPGGRLPAAAISRAPLGPSSAKFVYDALSRIHSSSCSSSTSPLSRRPRPLT